MMVSWTRENEKWKENSGCMSKVELTGYRKVLDLGYERREVRNGRLALPLTEMGKTEGWSGLEVGWGRSEIWFGTCSV